jgi:hypothetical protein
MLARRRRRRALRTAGVVGSLIALVLALTVLVVRPHADPAVASLSVSIDANRPGAPVPPEFLGLSFEMSSLRRMASYADRGNLAALLASLGPGVLRFGGVSADTQVAWTDAATPLPAWASQGIDVGVFRELRKLAARSGWRVLLTIGLAHFDPRAAGREAAAAKAALGGWLAGIEVGNEPDAYARHGLRSERWKYSMYDAQVTAYRKAIERAAPGLKLVGPDVSGSHAFEAWGRAAAIHQRPSLLTGHHYPLGCHGPAPTIERLLSVPTRRAEDASLHRYAAVSRRRAIGFRLDETNTVSCGGRPGISDRFASALWAIDYIAHAMAAGAVGINLEGNVAKCQSYTPLCAPTPSALSSGVLTAQPEWYALLLGKALVGDRPVQAIVSPGGSNVDVVAMLGSGGGLHVLVVDDETAAAKHVVVALHVARHLGAATVLALTGPSPSARTGVRLGGQAVESGGGWRVPPRLRVPPNRSGVITFEVSPASATLLTVAP